MKIAIIGAGKWGEALFNALSQNNECVISSRTKRNISNFVSIEDAFEYEYIVFALATQKIREFLSLHFKDRDQKFLIASKGIETSSGKFIDEIFGEFASPLNLAFLSGPSFASEVKQKLPCALVISSHNENLAKTWAGVFPNFIKTYISGDVIGSEICGAYKNVIAIASGICDGLSLGNNARASLISRGLVEITRFGSYFGAKNETFLGLSGAGDLFLTASSALSRNYRVGLGLAKGMPLDEILKELGEVAEGVHTAMAITKISKQNSIYTPIANEVCAMLEGKNVKESLRDLLRKK
ncbi:NAD(P)H-dependent glycerol-3-phosphate dehydrogenase [Campylobacter hyointestinalis subsp. hyointestinalis]|uniref:Glycerol-3-phosphate dehydrogenase [NAD(P)+] n=1 Tax=Campylobacter hyointestinalis subsp. hyointestinalis TaxID=91352 RepID=A0A9W5ETB8_CAMHY|nr:NAD(P)H-dependent glycerol-3-phosphate dehydrogenase [Campylobacter hyointestinalis]CUU76338.1 NAD(P)H-dependent glycerol-3-phosphate dehydrogenase [Campylobacter hyointestinalis subsp. hyointestinalis]